MQAATKTLPPKPEPALYRPRKPQLSDLYPLLETHDDDVNAQWEHRFEKAYGYWRGFVDNVVLRYFDCGAPQGGFARIVCEDCRSECLLCFSCQARNLCPSCDAKRAAAFAAFLQEELWEDVGHAVWSFSIPRMLRPYFIFHRELLTELARAGYETVHELMAAAVDAKNVRVGMVTFIQTFSDNLKWLAPFGTHSIETRAPEAPSLHFVLGSLPHPPLVPHTRATENPRPHPVGRNSAHSPGSDRDLIS